jgi:hypothetical protein
LSRPAIVSTSESSAILTAAYRPCSRM